MTTTLTLPEVVTLIRRNCAHCEDGIENSYFDYIVDDDGNRTEHFHIIECGYCTPLIRAIELDDVWESDDE